MYPTRAFQVMRAIKPFNNNGSVLLKFTYQGKRYSFSPGGKYADKVALSNAQALALRIQNDCLTGNFDPTLAKYKPERLCSEPELVQPPEAVSLLGLFEQFTEFKTHSLQENSLIDYQNVDSKLKACPYKSVDEAKDVILWLVSSFSPYVVKKTLKLVKACCNWGVESELIAVNPFNGKENLIPFKNQKSSTDESDINPFSKDERDSIIQAFESSRYYSHYSPLVKFLFFTGCRPNEARALTWKDISNGVITFRNAVTRSNKIKKGLKTQDSRQISINSVVGELIDSIKPVDSCPDSLIFQSPDGKVINWNNFTRRAWKQVLESAGVEYRNPYQTRHTYATLAIKAGVSATLLARWIGNSTQMIEKHYLGSVADIVPIAV